MSMSSAMEVLKTMPTPEQKAAAAQPGAPNTPDNSVKTEPVVSDPGVVEATPPKAETPPKDDMSSKFAALAKREKAIVRQQQEYKAREAAMAEREAKIAAREAKIQEADKLWDEDIWKSLEARGLDYNKLTKKFMEGDTKAPKETLSAEQQVAKALADFQKKQDDKDAEQKAEQEKQQKAAEAKQQAELQAAYEKFKSDIKTHIQADEAAYELINLYDQSDLVVDTIQQHFENTQEVDEQGFITKSGKVLSVKEASDMVEKYLEEEAQKALKSKKLGAKPTAPETKEKKDAPKTLHNQLTPTTSSTLPAKTEADRIKRALSKLG